MSAWVLFFKFPDRTSRDQTNSLTSLSTDGVAKEGLPKFNPRPGRGLNPGPSGWQSEVLQTVLTSHTLPFNQNSPLPIANQSRQSSLPQFVSIFETCYQKNTESVFWSTEIFVRPPIVKKNFPCKEQN